MSSHSALNIIKKFLQNVDDKAKKAESTYQKTPIGKLDQKCDDLWDSLLDKWFGKESRSIK